MQIKQTKEKEAGWLSIKLALITAFGVVVIGGVAQADCTYQDVPSQACTAKGEAYGGGCSGSCSAKNCGGGKTDTIYNGCYQCTTDNSEYAYCDTLSGFGCSMADCGYKTRNENCACIGQACDAPAGGWPAWPIMWSDSPNGNSCNEYE